MAFAALVLMGLVPGLQTFFGTMPLYGHSVWLNALTAAAAGYIGFRSVARFERMRGATPERRQNPPNRRFAAKAVALDRRERMYDRRYHGTLAAG
jgi:hypothetical protein